MLLPEEARKWVPVQGKAKRAHRPLLLHPALGPLIGFADFAVTVEACLGIRGYSVSLLASHSWQQRDGVHNLDASVWEALEADSENMAASPFSSVTLFP